MLTHYYGICVRALCVCVCVCVYAREFVRACVYDRVSVRVSVRTWVWVRACACVSVWWVKDNENYTKMCSKPLTKSICVTAPALECLELKHEIERKTIKPD